MGESFPSGQLCQGGDSQLVVEFKVKTGNQVFVTMTPLPIECLASKLVFGTKGLVLRSSMALIPTETSSIFREGKIHRMNYNMMKPIVDSIILSYISRYHSHTS